MRPAGHGRRVLGVSAIYYLRALWLLTSEIYVRKEQMIL